MTYTGIIPDTINGRDNSALKSIDALNINDRADQLQAVPQHDGIADTLRFYRLPAVVDATPNRDVSAQTATMLRRTAHDYDRQILLYLANRYTYRVRGRTHGRYGFHSNHVGDMIVRRYLATLNL